MAYSVTQDEIAEARRMNATYLQMYEPQELVRISHNLYTTKTHDSMKIRSDGRWYWWSRRIGRHTALDYIISVKGLTLSEAVQQLHKARHALRGRAAAQRRFCRIRIGWFR